MEATFRLLVTTRRSLRRSRARAASSVVVPMLMSSEAPSGMWSASMAPMRFFSSAYMALRWS